MSAEAAAGAQDLILLDVDPDGVAWLTLNRPDRLNSLNLAMRDQLWEALHTIRDSPAVRVTVFKGAGERAFSAGADISEFGTAPSLTEARRARRERDIWGLFLAIDKPFIAAAHGWALGAGCEMSLFCDIRIAAEDARFGLPEVNLGYIPSAGGTQMLPRVVRPGVAMQMVLSGEPVDAARALEIGLVHRVVPRERLYEEAGALARALAGRPPELLAALKRAVNEGLSLPLEQALRLEAALGGGLRAG
jgi:enoyl-CoA hydratase/carnithine racemase